MKPILLARDIVIVVVLSVLATVLSGVLAAKTHLYPGYLGPFLGFVFGAAGFTISALLTAEPCIKHLFLVALGVWLFGLLNLLFGASIVSWAISAVGIFLMMIVGWSIASVFKN